LAEQAFDRLRADIISGARAPNERLRIERLSSIYGFGPTPLREAMQRLCADRLVLSQSNRGFTVAPLIISELLDLNIARIAIEKEAIRLSIAAGDDDWEGSIVAALYRLNKQDAALRRNTGEPMEAWEAANAAFHWTTAAACGSTWLLQFRARLHDQFERYRRASVDLRRAERDLAYEHRGIAEAVLARDADAACRLIEAHFATTANILSEGMSALSYDMGTDH